MRSRNRRFSLWLNEAEFAHLEEQARITGLKKEPFVRSLIMNKKVSAHPSDEYTKLLRELSAIGNNVNQLAHKANAIGVIHVEEVAKLREAVNRLWSKVKEM